MRIASLLILGVTIVSATPLAAQPKAKSKESFIRGKAISAWVKDLQSKKAIERLSAISALRDAGPEAAPAVPALIAVFRDKDATFLHPLSAVALARIGPDALTPLQKSLEDKDETVRGNSALALGLIGPPARLASAALGKSMEDKSALVRFAAAQALGRIGAAGRPGLPALRKALDDGEASVRVESAAALWRIAEEAKGLDVLKKALGDENATVVQSAIATLGEMGKAAKSASADLKQVAEKSTDATRRIAAAEALYRVSGDTEAVKLIEKELKSKEIEVRKSALAALGTLGAEAKAVASLLSALGDKEPAIRRESACALSERGVKVEGDTAKALIQRLTDADAGVRWWSAIALIGSEVDLRKLDEEVLRALRVAFHRVGEKQTPPWTTIQDVAAPFGARATPALVEALKNRPARYKLESAKTLALLGMDAKSAQPALIEVLKVDDKLVRRAAAEALANMGPESLPTLAKLLVDRDARVREGGARALGQLGVPARATVRTLTALLKDDESAVRTQAALALWSIEQNTTLSLPVLNLVIKDVDNKDRWEAVEAIGIVGIEARPALKGLLEVLLNAVKDRDPRVKAQGAAWLFRRSRRARETVPLLREGVTDRDVMVRLITVEVLGEMGAEGKVVDLLATALEDREVGVRLLAEEALARGGKEMVPDLIAALKSKSPRVRAGVARALGMIGPEAKEAVKPLIALKEDKDASVKSAAEAALLAIFGGNKEVLRLQELLNAIEQRPWDFRLRR